MYGAYRPLVAVVAYHLADDRVARWPDGGYGVPAPYIDALRRSGARTAIVSPGEIGPPEEILEPYDGLLLVGGGDVDPARYGAVPDTEHNYGVEPDRDAFEIDLLLTAERMRIPVLCICRGMQVMNVAFGGTLAQHLPDRPGLLEHGVPLDGTETLHAVTPEPDVLPGRRHEVGRPHVLVAPSPGRRAGRRSAAGDGPQPRRPRRGDRARRRARRRPDDRTLDRRRAVAPGGDRRGRPGPAVALRRARAARPPARKPSQARRIRWARSRLPHRRPGSELGRAVRGRGRPHRRLAPARPGRADRPRRVDRGGRPRREADRRHPALAVRDGAA